MDTHSSGKHPHDNGEGDNPAAAAQDDVDAVDGESDLEAEQMPLHKFLPKVIRWSDNEDQKLRELYEEFGRGQWHLIVPAYNVAARENGWSERTKTQCRRKFGHKTNPFHGQQRVAMRAWTEEEDAYLTSLCSNMRGSCKWDLIVNRMQAAFPCNSTRTYNKQKCISRWERVCKKKVGGSAAGASAAGGSAK